MRIRLRLEQLRELVVRSNLSQNHWAMKIGLSRGHWSDIMRGKHLFVSARTREKILDAFRASFEDLFEVDESGDSWTHATSASFQSAMSDRYMIDRQIGQGGMGTVFLARDVKHGRQVAIKVVSPEAVSGIGATQFLKETRLSARLDHQNILTLLDSGEAVGYPFYVIPYVKGGSLRDLLETKGRLSVDETLRIVKGIARALTYAHGERVVHCDIKPENVLLTEDGHPYVADFGISRVVHREVQEWRKRGEIDSSAGTPAYVSPEQAAGELALDGRTDTYSLGCVIYEMLSGEPPFAGGTTMEVVSRRFTDAVPDVREKVPSLPVAVANVVSMAMDTDPRHRHESPNALAAALETAALESNPVIERLSIALQRVGGGVKRLAGLSGVAQGTRFGMFLERLVADLVFAGRSLRKKPGFALVALLTLAIGIGANSAIFGVVNGVFFKEPVMRDPETVVDVHRRQLDGDYYAISHQDADYIQNSGTTLFESIARYRPPFTVFVGGAEGPGEVVLGELVGSAYFDVLGVAPQLGRTFAAEEDDAPEAFPVAILSHRAWSARFAADSNVVGSEIRLNGRGYTVVGVAPQSFPGRFPGLAPDLWVPMAMENHLQPNNRTNNNIYVVARLADGVTAEEAEAGLEVMAARWDLDRGWTERDFRYAAVPYDGVVINPAIDRVISGMAALLLGAVAIVLLIMVSNLAGVLLARATERRKEIAVRLALGANRGVVVRQLLTESVLLALIGGALGLVLAVWFTGLFVNVDIPGAGPIRLDASLDWRVISYTLGVATLAGIVFGSVPAWQVTNPDLVTAIKAESGGSSSREGMKMRKALIVAQMGMSVVLLVAAGLFLQSFNRALRTEVGFSTKPAAVLSIDARGSGYSEEEWGRFFAAMRVTLEDLPQVEEITLTTRIPLSLGNNNFGVGLPDPSAPGGAEFHRVEYARIAPEYFDFFDVATIVGRTFGPGDATGPSVAVISEAAARSLWNDANPIGRTMLLGYTSQEPTTIVGVVPNIKIKSIGESGRPFLYLPLESEVGVLGPVSLRHFVARGNVPAAQLAGLMRDAAVAYDRDLFIVQAVTLAEHIGLMYYLPRMGALIISLFALLALTLASIGLYGTVSYSVASRTKEIGIRVSLGAGVGNVIRLMVWGGMKLVVIGIVLGLGLAFLAGSVLEGFLIDVSGRDPAAYVVTALLLGAVGFLASYIPARRVARVDPVEALRGE